MKILLVMETLGLGGSEASLVYLLPEIEKLGHECHVAALWTPHDLVPTLRDVGIKVHTLDAGHRFNAASAATRLARLCWRERFDVVHAKLFFSGQAVALSRWISPSAARVVSFHNQDYDIDDPEFMLRVRRRADRLSLPRLVDGFAALSRAVADCHSHWLRIPRDEIEVIPNAVPLQKLAGIPEERGWELRRTFGLPDGAFVALMPARLVPEKGHRFFVEAMARVRDPHVLGLIVGRGPSERSIAEDIRRAGLGSKVYFVPQGLDHTDIVALMRAVDLVAVPSTREGFGLAPAEAMAVGTPVVASGVGGLLDLVEHDVAGLLVPPASPGALAEAILRVARDRRVRKRLAEGGRARVVAHFTTDRIARTWDGFYRGVARGLGTSL